MQHGPGTENAFGGVAQPYGDSSPVVVLTGRRCPKRQPGPPNFNMIVRISALGRSFDDRFDPVADQNSMPSRFRISATALATFIGVLLGAQR
jgi:acetolactate synthase-1/2/3 large subunit